MVHSQQFAAVFYYTINIKEKTTKMYLFCYLYLFFEFDLGFEFDLDLEFDLDFEFDLWFEFNIGFEFDLGFEFDPGFKKEENVVLLLLLNDKTNILNYSKQFLILVILLCSYFKRVLRSNYLKTNLKNVNKYHTVITIEMWIR